MSNAAEKARRAREAAEQQRAQNRKSRNPYMTGVEIALAVGALSAILLFVGAGMTNTVFLLICNIFFWVSVVMCVGGLVCVYFAYSKIWGKWHMPMIVAGLLVTVLSVVSVSVYHVSGKRWFKGERIVDGVTYVLASDGAHIKGADNSVTDAVIPAEIEGNRIVKIENEAFKGNTTLRTISLIGDVEIGISAFEGCTNLSEVALSGGAFNLHNFSFRDCRSLSYVHVTSGKFHYLWDYGRTYDYPFNGCSNALTLEMDDATIDMPQMYDGRCLSAFSTIKLGARSSISTVETADVDTLVLKDDFRFSSGSVKILTGLIGKKGRPLAGHIYVPASIDKIGEGLFGDEDSDYFSPVHCYFEGDQSQWNSLSINNAHNDLYVNGKITMHYNSAYVG